MDIPSPKHPRAGRLVVPEGRGAGPRFLDQCVEAVISARVALGLSSAEPTVVDNFLTTHLGYVLLVGLRPDEQLMRRVSQGPWTVFEDLRQATGRAQRRSRALSSAQASLFLHGLRLLGRAGSSADYGGLAYVGRACYRCAAGTLEGADAEAITYRTVADRFADCSEILGQAGVELRFVDALPPDLLH